MSALLFLLSLFYSIVGAKLKNGPKLAKRGIKKVNGTPILTGTNQVGRSIVPKEELKERVKSQIQNNSQGGSLKLKPFDYEKIALDSFIIVIGKRRFGKVK